jgi:hypothetical protein
MTNLELDLITGEYVEKCIFRKYRKIEKYKNMIWLNKKYYEEYKEIYFNKNGKKISVFDFIDPVRKVFYELKSRNNYNSEYLSKNDPMYPSSKFNLKYFKGPFKGYKLKILLLTSDNKLYVKKLSTNNFKKLKCDNFKRNEIINGKDKYMDIYRFIPLSDMKLLKMKLTDREYKKWDSLCNPCPF